MISSGPARAIGSGEHSCDYYSTVITVIYNCILMTITGYMQDVAAQLDKVAKVYIKIQ